MMRRMMLIAASCPSNRLAAVTKRSGVVSACAAAAGTWLAGELMGTPTSVCSEPLDSSGSGLRARGVGVGVLVLQAVVRRHGPWAQRSGGGWIRRGSRGNYRDLILYDTLRLGLPASLGLSPQPSPRRGEGAKAGRACLTSACET